ncbi:MAG: multidrug efflux RND transporter permease subunit [Limnobacter sp.]|uniref:multidrug efflux RND transporter permease subunit n=1 Tax=Limnobacter sp. TaxID=2003368 RepID=UPI00391D3437
MNLSAVFIHRPVATVLLWMGAVLAGCLGFVNLPVSPLPQVDFPTISVSASVPGASAETMAATVATPLERTLGRIAGVTEITSSSSLGSSNVTIQFELNKNINAAAREVQAAINAARPLLPSAMPNNPTYRKVNPADSPIMILALTSERYSRGELYDMASTLLAQKLAQVDGVGQVSLGGSALPAVRVNVEPSRLSAMGLSLENLRTSIAATNTNRPVGFIESGSQRWQIGMNSQARSADEYKPLIVRTNNAASVQLRDVAEVKDSVQDLRTYGAANGKPAVVLVLNRAPNANIIATVDSVRAMIPQLKAMVPEAVNMEVVMDRTTTIRGSLREVEKALVMSVALVLLVVLLFLRRLKAALIPSVAVPVSLIATFGIMYLLGYSLDNLSLMALTVATGFVVDDAIVVQENIIRHLERGKSAVQAALDGAREIGFTVLSISISLVAVFIPVLFMGGIVGRLFREFAVTLSAAIGVSLLVSLTLTPALAAHALDLHEKPTKLSRWVGFFSRVGARVNRVVRRAYRRSLAWSLRHSPWVLLALLLTIAVNVSLYIQIPKGFFPQQDAGRIQGFVRGDQSASYQSMEAKMIELMKVLQTDPAVRHVVGFTGGGRRNGGFMFLTLKPLKERDAPMPVVLARMRKQVSKIAGVSLFLTPAQDVRIGGRQTSTDLQFTLLADDLEVLRQWEPKVREALSTLPELVDVDTDQQDKGLEYNLIVDRDAASRLGLSMRDIDTTLSNAFSQRQVSTIFNDLNQYRVVLGLDDAFLQHPDSLKLLRVITPEGGQVPLSAFARVEQGTAPLSVSHEGGFPASTISFSLAQGVSLSQATAAVQNAFDQLAPPVELQGRFQGSAGAFQQSLSSQPVLILVAIVTIYLVLGILYESLLHPLTILSTLPSAGVGALLALMLFDQEFGVIALIGVLLLIGIVKKNAILMIDFALERQRKHGRSAVQAIYRAAVLRFRPILMTTLAAMLGAVPLALGSGDGAELRVPLGIAIVGGLLLSQLLTLYTTPVVYVLLDKARHVVMGPPAKRTIA